MFRALDTKLQRDVALKLLPDHFAERPRLGVYKQAMAQAVAGELGIHSDAVSIKAKTNEGMGFIGRGEGIAVIAVATVEGRREGGPD